MLGENNSVFLCNLDNKVRKTEIDHAGEGERIGWIDVCVSEREWGPARRRLSVVSDRSMDHQW